MTGYPFIIKAAIAAILLLSGIAVISSQLNVNFSAAFKWNEREVSMEIKPSNTTEENQ